MTVHARPGFVRTFLAVFITLMVMDAQVDQDSPAAGAAVYAALLLDLTAKFTIAGRPRPPDGWPDVRGPEEVWATSEMKFA
ncbi:hypothetical protein [Paractinoplanes hotanensis]|uniref:Secreted protein n=1 Tax=Paractinoplanes hotanensis TaxID=2906497 RepID=A0ABT0Y4B0_9ACTN|nr:hypothetical protein [Actinoplanes hotanensis]MCM4080358.1 hypothetical protein [Actinoplanes hotanensis]